MKHGKRLIKIAAAILAVIMAAALPVMTAGCAAKEEEPQGPFPVIIVPGITGTELILDGRTVWPTSIGDGLGGLLQALSDFAALKLDEDAAGDGRIKPVQISPLADRENEDVGAANTYEKLANALSKEFGSENVYFFGYDWRLSNVDNAELLSQYISQVLKETGAKRVNIVAHSMGGLLTSAYLYKYKTEKRVDTVVTCGTPFSGSQSAYTTVSSGGGLLSRYGIDTSTFDSSSASLNVFASFPSVYELMPLSALESAGVMSENGDPLDISSAAQSKAYYFHENVTKKLSEIYDGVKHVNIVGNGQDSAGENGNEPGDGTVTFYSATAGGLFTDISTEFELSHVDIVSESAALKVITDCLRVEKE